MSKRFALTHPLATWCAYSFSHLLIKAFGSATLGVLAPLALLVEHGAPGAISLYALRAPSDIMAGEFFLGGYAIVPPCQHA